jgi:hypothetical protein
VLTKYENENTSGVCPNTLNNPSTTCNGEETRFQAKNNQKKSSLFTVDTRADKKSARVKKLTAEIKLVTHLKRNAWCLIQWCRLGW